MSVENFKAHVATRLPTSVGKFELALFRDNAGKDHMALYLGQLSSGEPTLTRIHSECFTGDVLGSRRCDCGEQLTQAMDRIAAEGRGVLLYLRQEGRGIGLLEKLRAYNLQDLGYDTVDANTALGHAPDTRDYTVASQMLTALNIRSVRLLTNNPAKVEALRELGIEVTERVPLAIPAHDENRNYLRTKMQRMHHVLDVSPPKTNGAIAEPIRLSRAPSFDSVDALFDSLRQSREATLVDARPHVTLSYAQSLDGCSAAVSDRPLTLSGEHSLLFTHRLRGIHDGILVGIGTVLADNPRLTVRLVDAPDPQPIILDSRLRFPIDAALLTHPTRKVWIATTALANPERAQRLEQLGAKLLRVPANAHAQVDLGALLEKLRALGINSLMVEGGGRVITQFMQHQLVDQLVVTVAPVVVGGVRAVDRLPSFGPHARLAHPRYAKLGPDMIVWGPPAWPER